MFFYQSGTPRVDQHQMVENSLCSHRLFSLHGSYERSVLQWLDHPKNGVKANLDKKRPSCVLLDSGAFTAWKSGHPTTVDAVISSYDRFISSAGDLFDEIWAINLDVIPGQAGRDPTEDEIKEAIRVSDINFKILTDKFGPRILPVYHQGEPLERALELEHMTNGTSRYICVSPRNDLHENMRRTWSQQVHAALKPHTRTHGLATTGNLMMERVPWYSVDSATWILVAAYGGIIYYWDTATEPRYMTLAVSNDGGRDRFQFNHFDSLQPCFREAIEKKMNDAGWTLEQVKTDVRPRSLFNMLNLEQYAERVRATKRAFSHQQVLFGV